MRVKYHKNFIKHYRVRISRHTQLEKKFQERLQDFLSKTHPSSLRNHKLRGNKVNAQSFSITGDIRIIYVYDPDGNVVFIDIGTHAQVY